MRKLLIVLMTLFVFNSCKTYIDSRQEIHSENLDFIYLKDYNEFIYKSKINAVADKDISYTTNFSVRLPKKIQNWQSSGNEFFFEYNNKEIIYLYSGYKNKGNVVAWHERSTDNEEVIDKLDTYWSKRKYNESNLNINRSDKVSKVYTDGRVLILLYNIDKESLQDYLTLIKSFKYLN